MNTFEATTGDTFQFRANPEREKLIGMLKSALQYAERADDGVAASLIANLLIEIGALEQGATPD